MSGVGPSNLFHPVTIDAKHYLSSQNPSFEMLIAGFTTFCKVSAYAALFFGFFLESAPLIISGCIVLSFGSALYTIYVADEESLWDSFLSYFRLENPPINRIASFATSLSYAQPAPKMKRCASSRDVGPSPSRTPMSSNGDLISSPLEYRRPWSDGHFPPTTPTASERESPFYRTPPLHRRLF